jgi:hypothetical protein
MFGMPMLEVLIGLVFIYLLLSLICTAINEMVAGVRDSREKHLRAGITNLFCEGTSQKLAQLDIVPLRNPLTGETTKHGAVATFYAHPLIKALNEDGTLPSYIPPAVFARVIMDMFAPADGKTPYCIPAFVNGVNTSLLPNADLKRTLLVLAQDATDNVQLRSFLEGWFNNSMDRVAAWYKNRSQKSLIIIAMVVCTAINADSIQLVKDLYKNPVQRSSVIAQAERLVNNAVPTSTTTSTTSFSKEEVEKLVATLGKLHDTGFSWGWNMELLANLFSGGWESVIKCNLKLFGIMLTAVAASLGAPFWFDMLNKLINIRAVGKSPTEKEKEPTKAKAGAVAE